MLHGLFFTVMPNNILYKVPKLKICGENAPFPLSPEYCFRYKEEIKKSIFITSIGHADSKETAKNFIDRICREFPDATHNCYAFAAGAPKDTACIGQSDNGEPHGTAGKPMLNVLLHSEVGEIAAVVTRYFGGIKLGTGGLVKAYQGGVAAALDILPTMDKIIYCRLTLSCGYEHINLLHYHLPNFDAQIISEDFQENITYTLELPEPQLQGFIAAFTNAANGKITILNHYISGS